jgi:hypothetical protein
MDRLTDPAAHGRAPVDTGPTKPTLAPHQDLTALEDGGDQACWLDRVCPDCGVLPGTGFFDECRAEPPGPGCILA